MNKYVTALILFAVLCSMGLVLLLHTHGGAVRTAGVRKAPAADAVASAPPANRAPSPAIERPASVPATQSPPPTGRAPSPEFDRPASAPVTPPPPSAAVPQPASPVFPSARVAPEASPLFPPSGRIPSAPLSGGRSSAGVGAPDPGGADAPGGQTAPGSRTSSGGFAAPESSAVPDRSAALGGAGGANVSTPPSGDRTPPVETRSVDFNSLSQTGNHSLKGMELKVEGSAVRLRIEADTPFPFKTFMLTNPPRLVVDLPGSWKAVRAPSIPANKVIKGIRIGTQQAGPRLVLDLDKTPKYESGRPSDTEVNIVVQ